MYDIDDNHWYWLFTDEGMKILIVFMYKEEMYPVFRRYNPRNTKPMVMPHKPKEKDNEDE